MKRLGIGIAAALAIVPALTASAASAAAAAPASSTARPPIYSAEQAGRAVSATGVHYRFVVTTFTLPDSSLLPYTTAGGLSVQLRASDEVFVLGISATPSSGWSAAAVDVQPASCTSGDCVTYSNGDSPAMAAGDSVTLSAYYNTGNGFLYYTAQDNTSGATFAGRFSDPGALFSSARVGAEFADFPAGSPARPFVAPATSFRLALLTKTEVTQINGTHVSLNGAAQVIETSDGTPTGTVQVGAPTVWNNGANVGIIVSS